MMKREKGGDKIPFIPLTRDKFDPLGMITTDPMGSYTGRPTEAWEQPVQDADDL